MLSTNNQFVLRYYMMMRAFCGSLNTKGFSSSISSSSTSPGYIPSEDHITYEGLFNEIKFSVGPVPKQVLDFHYGFARYQNIHSIHNAQMQQYLALFMKGSSDGQPRDNRILNSVIVLDVSGSMSGRLTRKEQGNTPRIELCKQAIKMFISKLRNDDSFSLVTFNNQAKTILPCTKKKQIDIDNFFKNLQKIAPGGGTTLVSGFDEAVKNLKQYSNKLGQQYVKSPAVQNRIVMLTDVLDNSVATQQKYIEQVSESGINMTLIGISQDFQSSTCERLKNIKGFNYFCATQNQDLKKHLFENFDYTFFPSTHNIEIILESPTLQIQKIQVFGTPDSNQIKSYNANNKESFVVSKMKTSFPSEIEIHEDNVLTYGGLILIKMGHNNVVENHFKAKVTMNYITLSDQKISCVKEVDFECPQNQQFFSQQCLREAMDCYGFASQLKAICRQAKSNTAIGENLLQKTKKWLSSLDQLEKSCPKSKIEDVNSIRKIVINMIK